ncbi:hypothetical protein QYF61_026639 [Mycteria americana]|uniref:Uncharacterized protein n=1 Tax=Mycteria americana TaxID=33587 RepID=A0AAN7MNK4_MYCAM|nr:hypothetical protein QYF61_026639 [Mycteria americana]
MCHPGKKIDIKTVFEKRRVSSNSPVAGGPRGCQQKLHQIAGAAQQNLLLQGKDAASVPYRKDKSQGLSKSASISLPGERVNSYPAGAAARAMTSALIEQLQHHSNLLKWQLSLALYRVLVTESQNRIGWKRPLRSSSPTINLTLPRRPLHHVPKHLIQTAFKYLQGWRLNHFPGQPVPMLDNPFSEVKFPNIHSKPPLAQLEAISSRPITRYLGEETDPHLSTTLCQEVQLIKFCDSQNNEQHCSTLGPLRSSSPTINLTLPSPPLHHVPKHLIQTAFKYLQGWQLHHFPGQPVPMLDNPFSEVKFLNIQSKPPLAQLEAISSRPITCYLGEETDPTSLHPPFRQL